MSRFAVRVAGFGLLLLGAPRSVNCAAPSGLCSCVMTGETYAQSIAAFASGAGMYPNTRLGAYAEVTLRAETEEVAPDATGLGTRRRFDPHATRQVWRFTVHRAWTVHGSRTRRRGLTLYGQTMRLCPEPNWERGKRYVVFVYPDGDTLRYASDCGREHHVDSLETRAGLRVLDSLFRRY